MLGSLGRWLCQHRRRVAGAWLVLFVVAAGFGPGVFAHLKDSNSGSGTESGSGFAIMDRATATGPSVIALIAGRSVDDPATRGFVLLAAQRTRSVHGVIGVTTTYDAADPRLRSADGRSSLMLIRVAKTGSISAEQGEISGIRRVLHDAVPGATVLVGGDLGLMNDGSAAASKDLTRGELIALPLLLVALILVFRGWRIALIPLAASLVAIAGALVLLLGITTIQDVNSYAVDVIILFGLALAVDYSLLMANRFREERALGADVVTATADTTATAGRTITFSALTVLAALTGLFAFGDPTFTSLALGGIATVMVALAAGLTLVPALLAMAADHLGHLPREAARDGMFGRLARGVQRRPLLITAGTSALLLAAALPFLGVHFGNGDPRTLPRSAESRQVAERLLAGFRAEQADPVIVVGRVGSSDPAVTTYMRHVSTLPGVAAVTLETGLRGAVSAIAVVPQGGVQSNTALRLVTDLRANRPPYRSYVTGQAAFLTDFKHHTAQRLPYALALIASTTFALLFLMTGSVLVPLKALLMNTLSLGATFGALVWVFQQGHLSGLLAFESIGTIELWVPIVVFVFAFGLSMDYEVFLLSRIKECHDEGSTSDEAVANGLQRSGRIITSAAGLVLIVFLGFAAGQSLGIKEMGLALAVAVVVDATIVRCLLVPATMTLLGDANWWAPAGLRRFHDRVGLRDGSQYAAIPRQRQPAELGDLIGPEHWSNRKR